MADGQFEHIVEVAPARPESERKPSASPVFRNALSRDGFPSEPFGARTLYEVFEGTVGRHPNRFFHGKRMIDADGKAGRYEWLTYREVHLNVCVIAQSLRMEGLKKGSKVGIYGSNSPEWSQAMHACNRISAVCVPLYDTLGANAIEYVVKHSTVEFAFVSDKKFKDMATVAIQMNQNESKLGHICVWGDYDVVDTQLKEACEAKGIKVVSWAEIFRRGCNIDNINYPPVPPEPEDLCTIMYTSGTTGVPKGVMISHHNIVSVIASLLAWADSMEDQSISEDESFISFLTLAHIYGRVMEDTIMAVGGRIGYWQGSITKLAEDIAELKPTCMSGVPRVWERMYEKVMSEIDAKGWIVRWLYYIGFQSKLYFLKSGYKQHQASPLFDAILFKKIAQKLGGQIKWVTSGAAPLAPHLEEFIRVSLSCLAGQGYGLTETCAVTCSAYPNRLDMFGMVGPIQPCAEFRLESIPEMGYFASESCPKGELCIRGPCLFSGYYKNDQGTKAAIDEDGFFHTGDVAELHKNGALKIIDRKKNIFKLSQGEYIAVERIECDLKPAKIVDQIWVYGNSLRRYLVAVVVPDKTELKTWARANSVEGSFEELCMSKEASKFVLDQLTETGKKAGVKSFEMVKAVFLSSEAFSTDNDLMTPSYKLKRPQLLKHFQAQIDSLYENLT